MKKLILISVLLFVVVVPVLAQQTQESQMEFLQTLGLVRYAKTVDASGSRQLLVLSRDGTGTFTHQHLTTQDGTNIEEALERHGVISVRINPETNKPEKYVMVFNPKDKHTYVWVLLKDARKVAEQIKRTGKTILEDSQPCRITESDDQKDMGWSTSF